MRFAPLVLVLAAAASSHASGMKMKLDSVTATAASDAYSKSVRAKLQASYLDTVRTCYRTALTKKPELGGKLSFTFTVEKKGAATQLASTFDPTFDPCLVKAVKRWKFTVPKDAAKAAVDATFTVVLTLTSPEEEYALGGAMILEGAPESSSGEMTNRRPGADLGQQIADVKEGTSVKVGGGGGLGGRADKGPAGRITVSDKQAFDQSTLTVDVVLRKVQSTYFAGLKRCYKTRLAVDATMRGKVRLELVVNEAGRATRTTARGFDKELDTCMAGLMSNWVFPVPKDADGEATEAGFSLTFALVPD